MSRRLPVEAPISLAELKHRACSMLIGSERRVTVLRSDLLALVEAVEAARRYLKTGSLTAEMDLRDALRRFATENDGG